ncbi:hypothetical protein FRC07_013011 [Ceratobasidium sp. 392]|nr:hypothetical protein FRC07_013011 [Ceratobasidium sp. 392]
MGVDLAKQIGAWGYVECSAKTKDGVAELFKAIAQMAVAVKTQPRPSMPFFVISSDIPDPSVPEAIAPSVAVERMMAEERLRSENLKSENAVSSSSNPPKDWLQQRRAPQVPRGQNLATQGNALRPNNLVFDEYVSGIHDSSTTDTYALRRWFDTKKE